MKRSFKTTTIAALVLAMAMMVCSCSGKADETTASESAAEETTVAETTTEATTEATTTAAETEATTTTAAATEATTTEAAATTAADAGSSTPFTDEMAIDAIQVYCVLGNNAFAELSGDHWVIESSTDSQVVVLFTSYTGSENRYYIDRATGETTVTELVPGIIDEEQSTGETFNARDYLAAEIWG